MRARDCLPDARKADYPCYGQEGVEEKINLQREGNKAKAYQVRQVRGVLLKYKMGGEADA